MLQAQGRARRYGQQKPVHVYNFLTLRTIDVDIVQGWTGDVLDDGCEVEPDFLPFDGFVTSSIGWRARKAGETATKYGRNER
jgi:hypothetical protein